MVIGSRSGILSGVPQLVLELHDLALKLVYLLVFLCNLLLLTGV